MPRCMRTVLNGDAIHASDNDPLSKMARAEKNL